MRKELALPIHNRVLDDLVGTGKLDYERTIRTGELLGLQDHETATISHDGTVFVLTHQCQELKLKLAAHELSHTMTLLEQDEVAQTIASIERVRIVFKVLTDELEILETLTPRNYQVVRATLGKGSGQESPGYNQIMTAAPMLWERLEALLGRHDTSVAAIYHEPDKTPHLMLLCEAFTTLDASWQKWLHHHFILVKRIIGVSAETESLANNKTTMLAASMLRPLFNPLWTIRNEMTHEWVDARGHH
jgi:tryptophan 2,3-dioxygenase